MDITGEFFKIRSCKKILANYIKIYTADL